MQVLEMIQVLSQAFTETAPWIALSMLAYHYLEARNIFSFQQLSNQIFQQISVCALLGAVPGCGGVMVVVRQYSHHSLTLGGLVAAMTATLGDAAFVLIAKQPATSIYLIGGNIIAGILVGLLVHHVHKDSFCRESNHSMVQEDDAVKPPMPKSYCYAWITIVSLSIATLFSDNQSAWLPSIGILGIMSIIFMYLYQKHTQATSKDIPLPMLQPIISSTNFLMKWIIIGYAIMMIPTWLMSINLEAMVLHHQALTPLLTCLTGIIPGCGPQVVVASLYTQHAIPLAAQIGNSISTSGDAFFPIFAIAPRATILATIYGFIFALITSYGFYIVT